VRCCQDLQSTERPHDAYALSAQWLADLLHADCDLSTQVMEKTTSSGEHGAQNRHPVYSTPNPGTYTSSRTFLTGTLAFDSPPLVSGLRSYPGTLSHFSFQPGSGEYSSGLLTFDGSARDAEVRTNDILPEDTPIWPAIYCC